MEPSYLLLTFCFTLLTGCSFPGPVQESASVNGIPAKHSVLLVRQPYHTKWADIPAGAYSPDWQAGTCIAYTHPDGLVYRSPLFPWMDQRGYGGIRIQMDPFEKLPVWWLWKDGQSGKLPPDFKYEVIHTP